MVGEMFSVTVTNCMAVAAFPDRSVTVHDTLVVPTGKAKGASLVILAIPQFSVTDGVPKEGFVATHKPVSAETVMSEGARIVGATLSKTVTCCVLVSVSPAA